MHCHCGTNSTTVDIHDPCKPEVRPGAREESASPAWLAAPAMNKNSKHNKTHIEAYNRQLHYSQNYDSLEFRLVTGLVQLQRLASKVYKILLLLDTCCTCRFTDSCLAISHSKFYGHQHARTFDDELYWQYGNITAIELECSVNYMHSIRMKYGDIWTEKHGTLVTSCSHLNCNTYTKTLGKDERITSVKMKIGKTWDLLFINEATFTTNEREMIKCGDVSSVPDRVSEESRGFRLLYISGSHGDLVDGLQFHWSDK